MSSAKLSGLETVQNLYLLHVQLIQSIRAGIRTPDQLKRAKENLRQFSSLLASADWRYMGGEDVYTSLQGVRKDISIKIGRSTARPVSVSAAKRMTPTKKPTKAGRAFLKTRQKSSVVKKRKK